MKATVLTILTFLSLAAQAQELDVTKTYNWLAVVNDQTYTSALEMKNCVAKVCLMAEELAGAECDTRALSAGVIGLKATYQTVAQIANLSCLQEVRLEEVFYPKPIIVRGN